MAIWVFIFLHQQSKSRVYSSKNGRKSQYLLEKYAKIDKKRNFQNLNKDIHFTGIPKHFPFSKFICYKEKMLGAGWHPTGPG